MVDGLDLQNDCLEEDELEGSVDVVEVVAHHPVKSGWARFGGFELVGNGSVTNEFCDTYRAFSGCLGGDDGERHNIVDVHGHDFRGKVAFQRVRVSCGKPSCPRCYRRVGVVVRLIRLRLVCLRVLSIGVWLSILLFRFL